MFGSSAVLRANGEIWVAARLVFLASQVVARNNAALFVKGTRMPKHLFAALLLLTTEVGERYVRRVVADAVALYLARRNCPEIESWLQRQGLD
jgi:hypothetical protein